MTIETIATLLTLILSTYSSYGIFIRYDTGANSGVTCERSGRFPCLESASELTKLSSAPLCRQQEGTRTQENSIGNV